MPLLGPKPSVLPLHHPGLSNLQTIATTECNVLSEVLDSFQMCRDMGSKKPEKP
jgi:hypothetical protein